MKTFAVCLVIILALVSFTVGQNVFNVKASAAGGAPGWSLLGYYPSALTVSQGDTIRFSVEGEVRSRVLSTTMF